VDDGDCEFDSQDARHTAATSRIPRWLAPPKLPRVTLPRQLTLPPQLAAIRLEQRTRAHAAHELRWSAYWRRELARQAEAGAHTFDARDRELRSLVRCGVSAALRAAVWPALCGVTAGLTHIAELYRRLASDASAPDDRSSAAIASIDLDIARTWPRHRNMDDDSRAALRRVLVALALTEPEVGYCQGLNEVAATLLLLASSEAEAFGMLVHLLRVALPRGWYGDSLSGSIAEGRVLALLLARHEPALSARMRALGVEPPLFCTQMFLCLFVGSLPFGVALRVWDCVLLAAAAQPAHTQSGCGADVLLRVMLALLRKHRALLVRAQHAGEFVRALIDGARATSDADELLRAALDQSSWLIAQPAPNGLPTPAAFPSARALRALRAEQLCAVERDLAEMRRRQEQRRAVRAAERAPSLGAAASAAVAEPAAASSEGVAELPETAAPKHLADVAPHAPASGAPAADRALDSDASYPLLAHDGRALDSDASPAAAPHALIDPQVDDAQGTVSSAGAVRGLRESVALDPPSAAETQQQPESERREAVLAPALAPVSTRTLDDDALRFAAAAAEAAAALASARRVAGPRRHHSAGERGLSSASFKLGGWLGETSSLARDALDRARNQVERLGSAASSTLAPSSQGLPPRSSTLQPVRPKQTLGGELRDGVAGGGGSAEHGACRPVLRRDPSGG
jgi:hypothetical protein